MDKKTILLAVPHMPAFDSCVPLMIRLHERGLVKAKILLGPRLRRVEPRAEDVLKTSGIDYVNSTFLGLELFSLKVVLSADFILTHSDPYAFRGKFRPRDIYTTWLKKQLVFVQHGMVQQGLHTHGVRNVWNYYAQTMLIWNQLPDPNAPFLDDSIKDRLHVTGITKSNLLATWNGAEKIKSQFASYDRRVLICHNYGFEPMRYSLDMFEKAVETWHIAAQERPNFLFVLRSHRGKRHEEIEDKIAALCEQCPNIIRSERHQGLTTMATIHDVMEVMDCVVSHPSTAILDAVYDNKPVAVLNSFQPIFDCLPQVDEPDAFLDYIDNFEANDGLQHLREIYGDMSTNLDIAAKVVEDLMQR